MKIKKHKNAKEMNLRESRIIMQRRIDSGYSQQEVASLIGVQVRQYQRLEYGERSFASASMKLGLSICALLNIDPFWLVLGKTMYVFDNESKNEPDEER